MIDQLLKAVPLIIASGTLMTLVSACGSSPTPTATNSPAASAPATTPSPSPSVAPAASPNAQGLRIERAVLAKKGADGKLEPVENGVFKRGDEVYLVLLNVGKFKQGEDGKNKFDLDLEAKDPSGKVILAKKEGLGEQGHVALPNSIAKTPYGSLITKPNMQPGKYSITLTIYDKLAGSKAIETKDFTLQ